MSRRTNCHGTSTQRLYTAPNATVEYICQRLRRVNYHDTPHEQTVYQFWFGRKLKQQM